MKNPLFQKLKQRDREETVPFDALARQYLKSLPGPAALLNLQTRKWWGNSAINEEDAELKTILEHWQQGEPLPEDSHWQTTRVTGTQWLVVLHERKSSD